MRSKFPKLVVQRIGEVKVSGDGRRDSNVLHKVSHGLGNCACSAGREFKSRCPGMKPAYLEMKKTSSGVVSSELPGILILDFLETLTFIGKTMFNIRFASPPMLGKNMFRLPLVAEKNNNGSVQGPTPKGPHIVGVATKFGDVKITGNTIHMLKHKLMEGLQKEVPGFASPN